MESEHEHTSSVGVGVGRQPEQMCRKVARHDKINISQQLRMLLA